MQPKGWNMTKNYEDLLMNWGDLREQVKKEVYNLTSGPRINQVINLIMKYGDAQAALERERVKCWIKSKLS